MFHLTNKEDGDFKDANHASWYFNGKKGGRFCTCRECRSDGRAYKDSSAILVGLVGRNRGRKRRRDGGPGALCAVRRCPTLLFQNELGKTAAEPLLFTIASLTSSPLRIYGILLALPTNATPPEAPLRTVHLYGLGGICTTSVHLVALVVNYQVASANSANLVGSAATPPRSEPSNLDPTRSKTPLDLTSRESLVLPLTVHNHHRGTDPAPFINLLLVPNCSASAGGYCSAARTLSPPASPHNEITRLSSRFASALKIDDPQFDLKYFGPWFAEIPVRMGTCELLDIAAESFLDAHDDLRSGRKSTKWPSNYRKAITSLSNTFQDPRQTKSPYTLCSIFMIMVSQMWASKSAQGYMINMECICTALNSTIDEPWDDSFAQSLRQNLIIPVCNEAILNPNLSIDVRYLEIVKPSFGPYKPLDKERGQTIESLDLPCLMRFPYFIRQPEMHQNDMIREYMRMQTECPFIRRRVMEYYNLVEAHKKKPRLNLVRAYMLLSEQYNMMLSSTLIMNSFLLAMDPTNSKLQEDALYYSQEAIWITRNLAGQLAMGAGFMPAALFAAWVATDDSEVIADITSIRDQHDCYWTESHYVEQYTTMKERVREIRDRKLVELDTAGLQCMDMTDFIVSDGFEYGWGLDAPLVDLEYLQDGNPRGLVAFGTGCPWEQVELDYCNWDPNLLL
ncbi:hypothetical protein CCM_09472 [Cordyceps militaris CM01]|uniref:Uncharacterized protein n=1 Tax=Cordyceps militaris (strain CM01) TaxID=983644 RepID=G3JUP9_CORMM|nr:uncharacterized protein CCM_09472 [Cordyceps militaris CM01]EGX87849.1 hypothetical protein CCM_09472 [Cordyceps militaris CM01]